MSRSSFARRVRTAAAVIAAFVLFAHHPLAATDDHESENIFWQSIQASTDPADFEAYLAQYKDGTYAALARNRVARLEALNQAQIAPLTRALADERAAHRAVVEQLEREAT